MNLKKIEGEFKKELLSFFSDQFNHVNNKWLVDKVMKAVREYIKQVVERKRKEIIKKLEELLPPKTNIARLSINTVKNNDLSLAYKDGIEQAIAKLKELEERK